MTTDSKRLPFLERLKAGVVVFDGAMGTSLQKRTLTLDDFEGLDGCNEVLVRSRPDVVRDIHAEYFAAGADVVETNTFGANEVVLDEYGLAHETRALNAQAARLAREVAASFTDRPRFVSGSIGPGTKLPSLGHIDYRTLVRSYAAQVDGLLEGGVDVLQIETCQDILQVKSALAGARAAFKAAGRRVPIIVQVTIETTGTMLIGTEVAAAVRILEPFAEVDVLGLNCATGPAEMEEHVRTVAQTWRGLISVLPNAGLPENVGGQAVYRLTPDDIAAYLSRFVREYGVSAVGGCCGTTPAHIAAIAKACGGLTPAARTPELVPSVASIYSAVSLAQEPPPLMVGERTNANGSRKFKQLLAADDFDGMVAMGRSQARGGAHLLDVCTAYVGRDEVRDMKEVVGRFATQVALPLMIDSTEPPVIEAALELIGGRAVVNSINLEDGGERLHQIVPMAKAHGAALVALTIDEQGMAKTVERKVEIARRIHDIVVGEYGMRPCDLIFDPLTFTIGSGDAEFRDAGVATLKGIAAIKEALPGVFTMLGLSNISFGLNPEARHVLNSVYLHEAVQHGLDAAIVHASKITPLFKIPDGEREAALDLVYDRWRQDGEKDPLVRFMALFEDLSARKKKKGPSKDVPIEQRLRDHIVDGEREGLEGTLDEALKTYTALEIINQHLLDGMRVVGELFGAGQMQLPFVLQSAEVMKKAVAYLEPHMDKAAGSKKGRLVLATVQGDVHDIGKNLVDIILTNNGYEVVNLGIKQPVGNILAAYKEQGADAIGLSGLLVKSTVIMKENLEELNARGISVPVILGGAALTRRYVEEDLRALYGGEVYYGRDAFTGLHIMDELCDPSRPKKLTGYKQAGQGGATAEAGLPRRLSITGSGDTRRSDVIAADAPIPTPPFWGARIARDQDLDTIFGFINQRALFQGQWQFKQRRTSAEDQKALIEDVVQPLFAEWKQRVRDEGLFEPAAAWGYFRAVSEGNDIVVLGEDGAELTRWTFPRQSGKKRLCLADFVRPREAGEVDVIALQAVTLGPRPTERCQALYAEGRYTDYLYLHGLAVETAEAMAELVHRQIRHELGIGGADAPEIEALFRQGYQGSRYSFGYPACPDLAGQRQLFQLLPCGDIGLTLTESDMIEPEQSTSAIVFHHPQARYFSVVDKRAGGDDGGDDGDGA